MTDHTDEINRQNPRIDDLIDKTTDREDDDARASVRGNSRCVKIEVNANRCVKTRFDDFTVIDEFIVQSSFARSDDTARARTVARHKRSRPESPTTNPSRVVPSPNEAGERRAHRSRVVVERSLARASSDGDAPAD